MGGALLVSLLALSLALAGCSDAEVAGSDITGRWTGTDPDSSYPTYTYVFSSDGSVTYTIGPDNDSTTYTGTWSLNGETVELSVTGTLEGMDFAVTETYEVLSESVMVLKSGSMSYGSYTYDYDDDEIGRNLRKSTT